MRQDETAAMPYGSWDRRGRLRRLCGESGHLRSKARQLRGGDWFVLAQALVGIVAVRLGLRLLPFRVVDRGLVELGHRRGCTAVSRRRRSVGKSDGAVCCEDSRYEERASWAVRVVANRLLRRRPCLTQALVLRLLLQRRGLPATLQIGVRRGSDGAFGAHAWLEREGRVLIGGGKARQAFPSSMSLEASPEG